MTVAASSVSYLHPLSLGADELPSQFTFPFRYTPHPLCRRAAAIVQEKLKEKGLTEGKMYGVLVGEIINDKDEIINNKNLFFLAAYSGQLMGRYDDLWFVPPVVDYLNPESHFQKEQAQIVELNRQIDAMKTMPERAGRLTRLNALTQEREAAVSEAKRIYAEGKRDGDHSEAYIRLRQHQKADIQRAKHLYQQEIAELEAWLRDWNASIKELSDERKRRSEALQDWLFDQFVFLNGQGERRGLKEIFGARHFIPSGAGECCAPKLLQAAYQLGLKPLAMAEFWWGTSDPHHYRESGAFFPACHSKCRPILGHMLQGLHVEADPADHYEQALKPVQVLWEDEYLAVIAKPEGWCSIPGRSDQANLFDEAQRLWPSIEGSVIVHRLDQDTSGVMVLAKTARVHHALSQQFEYRKVKKRYVALLESLPSRANVEGGASGIIDLPLAPDLENLPKQRVDRENGKEAVTVYKVIGVEAKGVSVAFYPQTGRTHQLRVHAASPEGLNAPIVGDRLYGHIADRLYLHAEAIDFIHPVTRKPMHFELPAPF